MLHRLRRDERGQTTVELALMAAAIVAFIPLLLTAVSLWIVTLQADAQAAVEPTPYTYVEPSGPPTSVEPVVADPGDGLQGRWWCVYGGTYPDDPLAGSWRRDASGPDDDCSV